MSGRETPGPHKSDSGWTVRFGLSLPLCTVLWRCLWRDVLNNLLKSQKSGVSDWRSAWHLRRRSLELREWRAAPPARRSPGRYLAALLMAGSVDAVEVKQRAKTSAKLFHRGTWLNRSELE